MEAIKKFYQGFTKVEELFTNILLALITLLVFLSAVARTFHHPLNWAVDFSLLIFAWEVFIGGDIAVRNTELIGVELISRKFPARVQRDLKMIFFVMIIIFCLVLTWFGIRLCLDNTKRMFQVLPISYSWCTLCVPVGCFLMAISSCIRIKEIMSIPLSEWGKNKEAVA